MGIGSLAESFLSQHYRFQREKESYRERERGGVRLEVYYLKLLGVSLKFEPKKDLARAFSFLYNNNNKWMNKLRVK